MKLSTLKANAKFKFNVEGYTEVWQVVTVISSGKTVIKLLSGKDAGVMVVHGDAYPVIGYTPEVTAVKSVNFNTYQLLEKIESLEIDAIMIIDSFIIVNNGNTITRICTMMEGGKLVEATAEHHAMWIKGN
jgi:hypothetical protein